MARITYRTEGGFAPVPGLSMERTLDTDELPAPESEALLRLVRSVTERRRFGADEAPPPHSADVQTVFVTVRTDDVVEELVLTDLDPDPDVRELVQQLRRHLT